MKPPTHFTEDHAVSMTLRDYFAAQVMQGVAANNYLFERVRGNAKEVLMGTATEAYEVADAMLKAREGK